MWVCGGTRCVRAQVCVCLIKSPLLCGCICHPPPPLRSFELAALSQEREREPPSLAAAYVIGVPQVSSTFPCPSPACLAACRLLLDHMGALTRWAGSWTYWARVINTGWWPLRRREHESILRGYEGQRWLCKLSSHTRFVRSLIYSLDACMGGTPWTYIASVPLFVTEISCESLENWRQWQTLVLPASCCHFAFTSQTHSAPARQHINV